MSIMCIRLKPKLFLEYKNFFKVTYLKPNQESSNYKSKLQNPVTGEILLPIKKSKINYFLVSKIQRKSIRHVTNFI